MISQPGPAPTNETALEQAIKRQLEQNQLPNFNNLLLDKIISRLNYEEQLKILKPKIWTAVGIFFGGLAILVFAFSLAWRAFTQTPASHYFSLIFTDFKLILNNWQDYSLGILESLPMGALILLLSGLLGSIFLVDFTVKRYGNFRKALNTMHYRTH